MTEYDDPATPGRSVRPGYVPQKTLYDVDQHYMLLMAKYDQANGNNLGPYMRRISTGNKVEITPNFTWNNASDQEIKYLYITEGTLKTNLASSG